MRAAAVVPAFEAEKTIRQVVTALVESWPSAPSNPVIVIDDGSTDQTSDRARAAGADVIRHPENLGKGAALRTGLTRARELGFDVAVSVDADGQHPADQALRLLDIEPADSLVLGIRDLARDGAPRLNRFSNGFANVFLSAFSGHRFQDTQCGLRRYPVDATLELETKGMRYEFESEIILKAAARGWTIVEVPVRVIYPDEALRVSHFDSVRDPARIAARILLTVARAGR